MALFLLLGAFALFLLVLVIRAIRFTPRAQTHVNIQPVQFDEEAAITALQRMVQCKTVSFREEERIDQAQFEAFRTLLSELFPLVHANCTLEHVGKGGLLYLLRGEQSLAPSVFMSHYDVVPVDEDAWTKPAFSGLRENGEIWGRGTLDTKGTLCAALTAAETLLQSGFKPKNDMYFSFGSNEETTGDDAIAIVQALKERGVRPALVLDEGGAVVEGVFPGVQIPCALIGTGEKGMLNVEFAAKSAGGHASAPPRETPIGLLAKAVTHVQKRPFAMHMSQPAAEMFDTLGRHAPFVYRLLFANLWCFSGLLGFVAQKSGGEINALLRTTCAFTIAQGGSALNVLPAFAKVCANLRLNGAQTMQSALAHLKDTVQDERVHITKINGNNPSPYTASGSESFARVSSAIQQTWPKAIVSPYLMVACSDSRFFCDISDNVLRFSAMEMSGDDRKRIHAHDERVKEAQFLDAVRFYIRVEMQS